MQIVIFKDYCFEVYIAMRKSSENEDLKLSQSLFLAFYSFIHALLNIKF